MSQQSDNFEIELILKVFLEEFGETGDETEIIYFYRKIELPFIPQIHSEIKCRLHPDDYGERSFHVRYVTTKLDDEYQLTDRITVTTEDTYTLQKFLYVWNGNSLDEVIKLCTQNGWIVTVDGEMYKG